MPLFRTRVAPAWSPLLPGAKMPALPRIKTLRQRRNPHRFSAELFAVFQDDLHRPVTFLQLSPNFNNSSRKLPHIPNFLQVIRKHNHAERAEPIFLAEVQIVSSATPRFRADDSSRNALSFADMFVGLLKRNASAGTERWEQQKYRRDNNNAVHTRILV